MSESFSFDAAKAGIWRFVPALSFSALMVTGFAVSVSSLQQVPEKKWQDMAFVKKIAQGESTRLFTSQLNEQFIWAKPFARIERGLTWKLVGDTGAQVRSGCPGWFFLSEELTPFAGGLQNAAARAYMVAQVGSLLKQRGVQLVVAVTPDKTRVEQSRMCGLYRPAAFAGRGQQWMEQLRSQQIPVIDLQRAFTDPAKDYYYSSDSHWNETGARAAAELIAAELAKWQLNPAPATAPAADAVKSKTQPRPGDLMRVANFEGLPDWWRPAVEQTTVSQVAPVSVQSDDLFGDAGLPPLALVGTSFSLRGNFVPFLSLAAGTPVANLAKDGGDFDGAAQAYLHSDNFRQQAPKVLIWEVPERMLQKPFKPTEYSWYDQLKRGQL